MVLVNSVVLVRGSLGLSQSALAWTMFAFGAGSMSAALALPKLLGTLPDRRVMFGGAALMVITLLGLGATVLVTGLSWFMLLTAWLLVGLGYSAVLTPSGRLLRRSADAADRPALFAAQFALSHTCWLVTYPLSGWLMTAYGIVPALVGLALIAGIGALTALRLWPANDPAEHSHACVVDENHPCD
jgi:predicted MFS family arabinose efflux permease